MENIEIRNLPSNGLKIAFMDGEEAEVFKLLNGAVCCRFATPPLRGKLGDFRIYLAIVYAEKKEVIHTETLTNREAQRALDKFVHQVKSLKKEFF